MPLPPANVTLGDDLKDIGQSIPCFLCHDAVDIRWDKHQKPYFVCERCGIQAFIRRKQGIRLLKELQDNSFSSLEIIQLTRELSLLKTEKDKLSSKQGIVGIFSPDEELIKAEEAITRKTQEITEKIKNIIEGEKAHD